MSCTGWTALDAYQLLTQIALSALANVVDTNYSAVTKVEKALLPGAEAYDGMHRHLRAQARSLLDLKRGLHGSSASRPVRPGHRGTRGTAGRR